MQLDLLEGLAINFATNEYRLLIVDSIMSLYRTEFVGRGELAERQQALSTFLRRATAMAEEFNLCVFMVCVAVHCKSLADSFRPTKSCPIQVQVLCLQGWMVESQLEVMF